MPSQASRGDLLEIEVSWTAVVHSAGGDPTPGGESGHPEPFSQPGAPDWAGTFPFPGGSVEIQSYQTEIFFVSKWKLFRNRVQKWPKIAFSRGF